MDVVFETERLIVYREGGRLKGREKGVPMHVQGSPVYIGDLTADVRGSVIEALERIEAHRFTQGAKRLAIKVNIGGGITGIPSSYTDPEIAAGVAMWAFDNGLEPFICEADMRGFRMTPKLLKKRGYTKVMQQLHIPFVNLSDGELVEFDIEGLDFPLLVPKVMLEPEVRIVSLATPKHHWECGVTLTQKNMYGALPEQRKSIYHRRGQRYLDIAVAAAARIMRPDIAVLAAKQICGGLGPHLCVPINFYRIVVSPDAVSADAVGSEILGFPYEEVAHARINLAGKECRYRIVEGSASIPEDVREKSLKHRVDPLKTKDWRRWLLFTYYIP
ncbi:MAG TPA: DUF362 domain-containing protein, partial [Proteobacteria bacterium]|nr:DUF362 domain-containing protein [Pseudomonadota bacterium]